MSGLFTDVIDIISDLTSSVWDFFRPYDSGRIDYHVESSMVDVDTWHTERWQLIHKSTGCWDDPIYVKLSAAIKKKLGLVHMRDKDIDFNIDHGSHIEGQYDADKLYLLQINDTIELVKIHVKFGGLDGSGIWYLIDLPGTPPPSMYWRR